MEVQTVTQPKRPKTEKWETSTNQRLAHHKSLDGDANGDGEVMVRQALVEIIIITTTLALGALDLLLVPVQLSNLSRWVKMSESEWKWVMGEEEGE